MYHAALDTSIACSLVIARDQDILFAQTLDSASREHDRKLPPWLLQAVASCNLTLQGISQWTVGTGPGSFAGLRSGIAHIMGICQATGAKLRGVPSAVAAAAAAKPQPGQKTGIIMDGRCGEIILAVVQDGQLCEPPQAMLPEELLLPDNACDLWLTPQPTLIPELPAPVAEKLLSCDSLDPAVLLHSDLPWPESPAELIESCTPIYVRPPVFVQPIPVNNLLA